MQIIYSRDEKIEKIRQLKLENPTLSYRGIQSITGFKKGLIRDVLDASRSKSSQKSHKKFQNLAKEHPIFKKWMKFRYGYSRKEKEKYYFDWMLLYEKFGKNPRCYLTGVKIDLLDPTSYSLDHIIPRSKGGTCSIDNCGLISREANMLKHNLTIKELEVLMRKVLKNKENWLQYI